MKSRKKFCSDLVRSPAWNLLNLAVDEITNENNSNFFF